MQSALCYYYFSKEKKGKKYSPLSRCFFIYHFRLVIPNFYSTLKNHVFLLIKKATLGGWQLERGGHNKKRYGREWSSCVCLCKGTTHYLLCPAGNKGSGNGRSAVTRVHICISAASSSLIKCFIIISLVGGDARLFMETSSFILFFFTETRQNNLIYTFSRRNWRDSQHQRAIHLDREKKSEMIGCLGAVKEHFDVYGVVTTLAKLVSR